MKITMKITVKKEPTDSKEFTVENAVEALTEAFRQLAGYGADEITALAAEAVEKLPRRRRTHKRREADSWIENAADAMRPRT